MSSLMQGRLDDEEGEVPDFYSLVRSHKDTEVEEEVPDFYAIARPKNTFLEKLTPRPFEVEGKRPKSIPEMYLPPEINEEEFDKLPRSEKMKYLKELEPYREFQRGEQLAKLGKGAVSGLTMSASEYIPGLETEEQDFMTDLGHVLGSYVPISGLFKVVGAPLVKLAAKSPVARGGLMALARMTGFGLTGATHRAGEELIQGEIPNGSELLKTGAEWAAIDAAMQALGLGVAFNQSIKRIAATEGITAKEAFERLWDATKNYVKLKFGRAIKPNEILPEDAEVLFQQAKQAEAVSEPFELEGKAEKSAPIKPVEPPEGAVLGKPEDIRTGVEGGKASASFSVEREGAFYPEKIALSPEERQLIDAANQWEKAGDHAEASKLAQQAREMIFTRLTGQETAPPSAESQTFSTSKGSTYTVNPDGTTTRTKAARTEHPGEAGLQTPSEKTWYITPENSVKLGEIQTKGEGEKKIVELPNGQIGVQYLSGKDAGKIESRTLIDFEAEPKEGLIPVEAWDDGKKVHFGNQIVQVGAKEPQPKHPEAVDPSEWNYTREDFPTLKEAADYLNHLERSIGRVKEGTIQAQNLERDIANLNEIVAGYKREAIGTTEEVLAAPLEEEVLSKKRQVPPAKTRPLKPSVMGKEQAVARSTIIDTFRKAFTDPIRMGKFRQRAAGIHKMWPKVTRLLQANDVETAAHEIGHNLHTTLYGGDAKTPKEQSRNIDAALRPYLDELKPLAHYEPWGKEGFAEFTRLYVTNPDVAKEFAPKFYDKFENDLRAEYPEMYNALLDAREYYRKYLHGTPQSRIRAQTSYAQDKGKLANLIEGVKKYLDLDYLKTQFLDDVYPAKKLVAEAFGIPLSEVENLKDEANLYRSLRVLKGAVGKGDVFVLHETFDPTTLEKINGSLRDILKQLPDEESYRAFNDYLIARRAIEKAGQGLDTGIELGDALTVEKELHAKYGPLAKELDRYNDSLLSYAKKSGLLSEEQYKAIKKNNLMYVPFQRVMDKEKGGVAAGGGRLQAGKPIKRMTGSSRDIIAPIESVLKNTYAIIINSEKNLAGQTLAKIAKKKGVGTYVEHVPTPIGLKAKVHRDEIERSVVRHLLETGQDDFLHINEDGKAALSPKVEDLLPDLIMKFGPTTYPAGENIVTVYVDGKPRYYEVSPELHEMWTKGIAPYTASLITKILRFPATTLRAGAVLNPRFIQKNFIRDTWGSWLFTKYGKDVKDPVGLFIDTLYSPFAMMAASAQKMPLYIDWMKAGGGMSTMQSLDRQSVVKKLDEVRNGLKPHQIFKWLRAAAEISEEANRLTEFGKALAVEGRTRLGMEIAAFASRDLSIDFAKMGLQTKALNQIIPFWNATVQGGDKLLRTLLNPNDRKNFIPRVLGFIVIPSLMLAWLNKDDERVKEFYEEEKDFNFITFIGDKALKIPVPFETGVIAHGLTRRMFDYFIKKDPEAFEKYMGSVIDAMMPNFIPAIANPFIETWANKNFFTGSRIIPANKEGLIAKYQYKNNTSTTARLLGRAMSYMLGQETRSKAASPAIIDHFVNSWGGGLGRLMISITDASLETAGLGDKIPGPKQAITERLGLDAFVARYPRASTRSIEKFYDNYADATARHKSLKHAEKEAIETDEELGKGYERLDKIYDYKSLQRAYQSMQGAQREINGIWNDPSIDTEYKKTLIDDLYQQMIDFAKAANEDIKQYRLAQG